MCMLIEGRNLLKMKTIKEHVYVVKKIKRRIKSQNRIQQKFLQTKRKTSGQGFPSLMTGYNFYYIHTTS